ncbi:MAG: thiol-disulfide oxidoreductase DCC family protein [Vulcanimicrobiaceae bacterium]
MGEPSQRPEPPEPRAGWILYDGSCAFCTRTVNRWKTVLERRGFAIRALQSAWADGSLKVAGDQLLDDVRLLTRTGDLIRGADVYLYVMRRIWWARPFGAILRLPGPYQLLWWGYRWVARNRACAASLSGEDAPNRRRNSDKR